MRKMWMCAVAGASVFALTACDSIPYSRQTQGAAIGAAAGALVARSYGESMGLGASLGAIGGLIVGVFGSGIVLMVMGWIRAAKRAG